MQYTASVCAVPAVSTGVNVASEILGGSRSFMCRKKVALCLSSSLYSYTPLANRTVAGPLLLTLAGSPTPQSRYQGHITSLMKYISIQDTAAVIAAGGDGTVNEVCVCVCADVSKCLCMHMCVWRGGISYTSLDL